MVCTDDGRWRVLVLGLVIILFQMNSTDCVSGNAKNDVSGWTANCSRIVKQEIMVRHLYNLLNYSMSCLFIAYYNFVLIYLM